MDSDQEPIPSIFDSPPRSSPLLNGAKRPLLHASAPYPRKRALKACQCNSGKPHCSVCLETVENPTQKLVSSSNLDSASLQILQRLDDLEQLVRHGGDESSLIATSIEPNTTLERLDHTQFLPCAIDLILEWDYIRDLRGEYPRNGLAFPSTGIWATRAITSLPAVSLEDMGPDHIKKILDNFFNHVHVKIPILDERFIRQTVSQICTHGIDWSALSCLALLVCAIGSIATPFDSDEYPRRGSQAYCTAESLFVAAKKRLGLLDGGSSLFEAQCFILAGIYSMYCFERVSAWRYFVQALACCQSFQSLLPLTHLQQELEPTRQKTARLEQATYWSAWKSERDVNDLDLVLPGSTFSALHLQENLSLFSEPNNAESSVGSEEREHEQSAWSFYRSEISLLRLQRQMSIEIFKFKPLQGESKLIGLAHAVAGREQQIEDWTKTLPDAMSMSAPPDDNEVCRFILKGHLLDTYELLYWPFVDWAVRSDLSNGMTPLLKRLATKGLQMHEDRLIRSQPGFTHRHHGTFGMIKACTRSALILLAAANAQNFEDERHEKRLYRMPRNWQPAVYDILLLLNTWAQEAPDLLNMAHTLGYLWNSWKQTPLGQTSA